jgi:hypothetical protein
VQALVYASPASKGAVLRLCANLGVLDALESLQYGPSGGGTGSKGRLQGTIGTLLAELSAYCEEEEEGDGSYAEEEEEEEEEPAAIAFAQQQSRPRMDNKPAWMTKGN